MRLPKKLTPTPLLRWLIILVAMCLLTSVALSSVDIHTGAGTELVISMETWGAIRFIALGIVERSWENLTMFVSAMLAVFRTVLDAHIAVLLGVAMVLAELMRGKRDLDQVRSQLAKQFSRLKRTKYRLRRVAIVVSAVGPTAVAATYYAHHTWSIMS